LKKTGVLDEEKD